MDFVQCGANRNRISLYRCRRCNIRRPSPTINGYIKSKGRSCYCGRERSGGAGFWWCVRIQHQDREGLQPKGHCHAATRNTQDIAARVWLTKRGYRLKEKGGTFHWFPCPTRINSPCSREADRRSLDSGAWLARLELGRRAHYFGREISVAEGKYVTTHLVVNRSFLHAHRQIVRKPNRGPLSKSRNRSMPRRVRPAVILMTNSGRKPASVENRSHSTGHDTRRITCDPSVHP